VAHVYSQVGFGVIRASKRFLPPTAQRPWRSHPLHTSPCAAEATARLQGLRPPAQPTLAPSDETKVSDWDPYHDKTNRRLLPSVKGSSLMMGF